MEKIWRIQLHEVEQISACRTHTHTRAGESDLSRAGRIARVKASLPIPPIFLSLRLSSPSSPSLTSIIRRVARVRGEYLLNYARQAGLICFHDCNDSVRNESVATRRSRVSHCCYVRTRGLITSLGSARLHVLQTRTSHYRRRSSFLHLTFSFLRGGGGGEGGGRGVRRRLRRQRQALTISPSYVPSTSLSSRNRIVEYVEPRRRLSPGANSEYASQQHATIRQEMAELLRNEPRDREKSTPRHRELSNFHNRYISVFV